MKDTFQQVIIKIGHTKLKVKSQGTNMIILVAHKHTVADFCPSCTVCLSNIALSLHPSLIPHCASSPRPFYL